MFLQKACQSNVFFCRAKKVGILANKNPSEGDSEGLFIG